MVEKVVTKTGAKVWEWGMIYKSVFQMVLLYGSKIFVVTGDMLKTLEELHHRASRRIAGMTDRHMTDGEWERPPVDDMLETAYIVQ